MAIDVKRPAELVYVVRNETASGMTLQIHPDGSLWKDDVELAATYVFDPADVSVAAKRLSDAIDERCVAFVMNEKRDG